MTAKPPILLNGTIKTDANKNDVIENGSINGVKDKHKRHNNEMSQDAPSAATHPSMEPKTKEARILAKITYDDLGDDVQGTNKGPTQLNLAKVERYLHGPVPSTYNPDAHEEPRDMGSIQYQIQLYTDTWNTRTPHKVLVSATAAVNALGELSPGGALMRGFQEQSLARKQLLFIFLELSYLIIYLVELVPPDFEKDLRNLYLSLNELLKHFWGAFPPNTPDSEAKAIRMHETLQRFQMAKLKPFEVRIRSQRLFF